LLSGGGVLAALSVTAVTTAKHFLGRSA
jgi:hypothetical protein